ncbi:MAG: type I restriction endonuclease subunit R [Bacteroidales bacterium]|nr:type I restriction endonuclease subunit R [Bacteroidales bacterium]MBQ4399363.1 type I restriction endonuclease subunit R [Bacteroidales bacterium]
MIQSEAQLEQQFLEKLQEMKYTYRSDIRDLDALERNFRQKFERLNFVTLSDEEFRKLLQENVTSDVFTASKHLRERQTFVRSDGTTLDYNLVNTRDWCKNEYEVVNQLTINTANSRQRYDVIILINGLPLVQIELKRHSVSPLKAVEQIVRYKQDRGNGYTNTLMCFMQLFIVSNGGSDTMYFANNNDEHFHFDATNNYLPVYHAADHDNNKIAQLFDFADMMLQKCEIGKLISRYMVLVETEKKILVMRPYQIYAVESIVNCVEQNNQNGFIWHTTGSGKTLTSFKASTLLKDNSNIEKCVFVVDRKDLDKQTRDEFNKFQEGCVEQNANTAALVSRLESTDYADKVIVTTIQKLGIALDTSNKNKFYQRLQRLSEKRIVFIFDECHRSQFGENHKAIKSFFPHAQLFGFTGTPIFEPNSHVVRVNGQQAECVTTQDVFQKCLHKYTITHAINDNNVLRFKVEYYGNKTADGKPDDTPLTKNQIVAHILDNHDKLTAQRRFNALLATPSIPDAIRYYQIFKEEQERRIMNDPDYVPLNITAVFTPPMKNNSDEDLPQEEADNKENPDGNREALSRIIDAYNKQFDTNFSVELFDEYYRDVQQRIKDQKYPNKDLPHSKKLDVVIVVEMMLTGFDSKFLNTLYVAKDLKWHALIQAFSRTNRILDGTKPYGNIICYRDMEAAMEEAMVLFSGYDTGKGKEYWLVEPAETVVEQYKDALAKLETVMNSMGLECKPEEVINIPQGENTGHFIDAFKDVQRLSLKLDQYVDMPEELKTAIEAAMPEDTLQQFRTAYLDLARRLRPTGPGRTEETPEGDAPDFELSLFSSALVDYDYIMKLLARYTNTHFEKVKITKEQLLEILSSSVDLMNEREYLKAFIEEELEQGNGMSELEIRKRYQAFKDKRFNQQIAVLAEEYGIDATALETFVSETAKLRRIDEDVLRELLNHIDGWKQRKAAKEGLLVRLAPLFDLLSGGSTIEGLNAYVK